eukprot:COSAG01_NODE_6853_length_3468_cov_28.165331_3_plen_61_part_00
MRSLVKRLGMGLPNNLLPKFPAITGSLIDRSIDLLLTFLNLFKNMPGSPWRRLFEASMGV